MKKEELRIGNLYEWVDEDKKVYEEKVYSLESGRNHPDFFVNAVKIERCRPIKLTEARLLALGFNKVKYAEYCWFRFKVGKWEFITNDSNDKKNKDWYIGWANGADDFHFDKKINQVHLVQNLVYALTHKEI
jgi:hypothetical protein